MPHRTVLSWLLVISAFTALPGLSYFAIAADATRPQPLGKAEIESALQENKADLQNRIRALEDSVTGGTTTEFDRFLQNDWLLDRVTGHPTQSATDVPADVVTAFRTGTLQSWKTRSMAAEYVGQFFRYQRVISLHGRSGLLFRAVGERGQLGFLLLTLAQDHTGALHADDVLPIGSGEFASDTLRRNYLTLVASLNPRGPIGRRATAYIDHLPQVLEFNHAITRGEFAAALALYDALPALVRQDRALLLGRLNAAEHVSADAYAAVFAEWQRLHPDPMSLPLKSADYFLATGRYYEAEMLLRRLDEALGGDVYVKQRLGALRRTQRALALQTSTTTPATPPSAVPADLAPGAQN